MFDCQVNTLYLSHWFGKSITHFIVLLFKIFKRKTWLERISKKNIQTFLHISLVLSLLQLLFNMVQKTSKLWRLIKIPSTQPVSKYMKKIHLFVKSSCKIQNRLGIYFQFLPLCLGASFDITFCKLDWQKIKSQIMSRKGFWMKAICWDNSSVVSLVFTLILDDYLEKKIMTPFMDIRDGCPAPRGWGSSPPRPPAKIIRAAGKWRGKIKVTFSIICKEKTNHRTILQHWKMPHPAWKQDKQVTQSITGCDVLLWIWVLGFKLCSLKFVNLLIFSWMFGLLLKSIESLSNIQTL